MKWENLTERKKLLTGFSILYVATIACLVTGFIVLSGHENPSVAYQPPVPDQVQTATVRAIDKANDLLGRHADKLRQLDGKYINQLIDSFNRPALEDVNIDIRVEEASFGKAIDSLEREGSPYVSLAGAFRNVLNDHLALSNIRLSLPSGMTRPDDKQRELLLTRKTLQEKDDRIALLERRLQDQGSEDKHVAGGGLTLASLQADNDVLRQQLGEQAKTGATLKEQVGLLQHNNETLNSRLNDANGTAGSKEATNTTLISRNSALERKSAELADELRFAQVDCNLSRADGRQLIYNARQRKDLLMDALATLNDLSKSPNAEVQQKAKDRLSQLKSIAATVHD